jgi:two-component system probable response regulator PhcQ
MSTTTEMDAAAAGTILFVDDEPLSLKYFKASVGRYANVVTANTAEAAMKILEAEGDAISVVVSDERMPRDNGVSFLSNVRKSWPSTVRILTSAYANIDLQQAINGAAIHRFLPKPWDLDELCAAMQEALHAERAGEMRAEPHEEIQADAENASLELLAVLTQELLRPLQALDAEALKLSTLSGLPSTLRLPQQQSQSTAWSAQFCSGTIAAAADQIRRDIAHCRALAEPIAGLAESLCEPISSKTYSMAETATETLEKFARNSSARTLELDARKDFQYRAPKQIVSFVLRAMLQRTIMQSFGPSNITIELMPAEDYNEVRITGALSDRKQDRESQFERATRSALWAFGGELLLTDDTTAGTGSASIRLPKLVSRAARASH